MTTIDVMGAVELTVSAAIMVAVLSTLVGRDPVARVKYAAVLFGWFVIVVVLAASGALQYPHGIGTPGLGLAVGLPIVLIWFAILRLPKLRNQLETAPLALLVLVNAVRILGVSFLILQADHRLPAPFAPAAGWGDIIAGVSAVPVAWMVYRRARGWKIALSAWNVFGTIDLITAISLGVLSSPGPLHRILVEPGTGLMTTLPWLLIPGFLVPLLMITHLAIFHRLIRFPFAGSNPALATNH
jgi:hypothetical protein